MSNLSDSVFIVLRELFPQANIKKEHYVKFRNCKLFFDFFMPQYNILVEVQGKQHYAFVEHFHGDPEGFMNYKKRDKLKEVYAEENDLTLVVIDYNEDINRDFILEKIIEAQK